MATVKTKMAALAAVLWSSSNLFSFFLLLSTVTSNENTTSFNLNTTVLGDRNVTFDAAENDTTSQPTEFDSLTTHNTTPTLSSPEEEPVQPTLSPEEEPVQPTLSPDPLPVNGLLLSPVTDVDRLCPCDKHKGVCDVNCCCDRDCSEEVALFTSCSVETVSGNKQLCSRNVASYSLRTKIDGFSEIRSSVKKETSYDIFCIQSQNRVDGFSHPSPTLPTDGNFDSLFDKFTRFIFGSEERSSESSSAELQASSGYQYGDVMATVAQGGQREMFMLPAPGVTAECVDNSPAAFLKDQSSRCSQQVVLDQDCSSLPALSMDTYTNIQLLSGKSEDAAVVPVEVASLVLQSVDGTQSELQISGGENFSPVLLNPTLCANVVLKVVYTMKYSPSGEIGNVTVSLVLGFVSEAALTLEQEFHITFVQEDKEEAAVQFSGNPGYVFGLPLVSGTKTADGISRSINPRDTLSLLHSTQDQDCLRGRHQRSPVLFGVDSVSGCTLRLEDAANCSQVYQVLLDVLRGPNYPQYVASFGNSPLDSPLDWVPIKSNLNPGEAQSCSVPLSLHLKIEWTKYGSLVNPQPQIVSIEEIIQTNSSSLALLSAGSTILSVSSSVSFTPVSAPALPGYRATPTIDAKLPFDFFFPFV
ncbi:tectonic-1-like isoform X2 [Notolabrus celidotus]|uniref:tectonic-1-like isoform X2 n=1 Tax=Notolabrus celidotus TaxID=1203425 RepID=UPI00148FFD8E|nr:tectonic-1-like isoform X2 [Notolabrus celidotus]